MNKKGFLDNVMVLVLALFTILLLFIMIPQVYDYLRNLGDTMPCELSVVVSSTKIAGQSFTDINCPAEEITFEKDDLFLGGNFNEDKLKRSYAEEMRKCWKKMGEGNLEPFSENMVSSPNICVICSKIEIADDVIGARATGNFSMYLETTEMKGSNITYGEYMSKTIRGTIVKFFWYDTGWGTERDTLGQTDIIDPSERHYAVFTLKAKPAFESIPIIGDTIPDVLVDWNAIPGIFLVQEKNFRNLNCQRVYQ